VGILSAFAVLIGLFAVTAKSGLATPKQNNE
jgi:hypothetical protein